MRSTRCVAFGTFPTSRDVRVGSVKRIKADFTDASGMMGSRPQVILSSVKAMSDAAAMVRKEII